MPTATLRRAPVHTIALAVVSATVFVCSLSPLRVSAGPGGASKAAKAKLVKAGKELFTKNCMVCHGANAKGTKTAPKLAGTKASDARITKMVTNGKPGQMPAFGGKLKPADIKALI